MNVKTDFYYPMKWLIVILFISQIVVEECRASDVVTWQVYEIELTAQETYDNPYAMIQPYPGNDLITARFQGVSGEASGMVVDVVGFWYEGDIWKIRFAPPVSGTWEFMTSSDDTGLNGKSDRFEVQDWNEAEKIENPNRRGPVIVSNEFPNYFSYTDGTPFLWIGDTWWNWTKRSIHFSSFQNLVDDRSDKGFTMGQLFVAGNGWGRDASILDETYTEVDLELMQKVDRMIEYANSKGLTIWVHGWWSRDNIVETIGEENVRRWWRYLVHRLGAYNVVWTIAGEYNLYNYGGFDLSFWKELGLMIKDEDPYERIVGAHPTPPLWGGGADAPQWSTGEVLHEEPWLDYNQSQPGHGRWRQEMTPMIMTADRNRVPAKPTLVTEPWYEFVEGNPSGKEVRFGAWSSILSGAAGHTYGGGHVWLAHLPESPAGGGSWPLETDFDVNTLDYEGARSMSYMVDFFSGVEWWKMEPAPELIHDYREPYCLANKGEEYVVYLRWGGPATIDLGSVGDNVLFKYRWFNPATGEFHSEGEITGGGIRIVSPVEDYPGRVDFRDWVLHIKKAGFE